LGIKVKNLTAEYLYTLVREKKVSYQQINKLDPKKFGDLEDTMKMIFNHDDNPNIPEMPDGITPTDLINMNTSRALHSASNNSM
jgi:hypothetical protein